MITILHLILSLLTIYLETVLISILFTFLKTDMAIKKSYYQIITLIKGDIMDREFFINLSDVKRCLNDLLFTLYTDIYVYKCVNGVHTRIAALNRYDYKYTIFLDKKTNCYKLKKN